MNSKILNGLELGDKVVYYSKDNNKSGVGYIFSVTEFAAESGLNSKIKIRSSFISLFADSIELRYDSMKDVYMYGGIEYEIKKV